MAYVTGSASTLAGLMDAFKAFVETNAGYTVNNFSTDGAGKKLHIQKTVGAATIYFNFRTLISENSNVFFPASGQVLTASLLGSPATGYSGAAAWYAQAGAPSYTNFGTNHIVGGICGITGSVPSYHFFWFAGTGYDCCYCVVEHPAGTFQHFGFGHMKKHGTWTGGQFYYGAVDHLLNTVPNSGNLLGYTPFGLYVPIGLVACTSFDGFSGWMTSRQYGAVHPTVYLRDEHYDLKGIVESAPNSWNSVSPLDPFHVIADMQGAQSGGFSEVAPCGPIGLLPELYVFNVEQAVPAGQITITTDTYRVFPVIAKSSANLSFGAVPSHSRWLGVAMKSN